MLIVSVAFNNKGEVYQVTEKNISDLKGKKVAGLRASVVHQVFSAALADEFLFMEHGRIVERGAPSQLLARDSGSRTQSFCAKLSELAGDGHCEIAPAPGA